MADSSQQYEPVRSLIEKKIEKNKPVRCFELPDSAFIPHHNHMLQSLLDRNFPDLSNLGEQQQTALARLVPMLLCGEQSAMFVFHREAKRLEKAGKRTDKDSRYQALMQIEADEFVHEQVLQKLLSLLPLPADFDRIRKRSRLFYTRIDRQSNSLASHFWQISQLDACVCLILSALNRAMRQHSVSEIFQAIMQDEARHVSIARQHALSLSKSHSLHDNQPSIPHQLIKLIQAEAASFQALDVDTKRLFKRIEQLSNREINP